MSVLPSSITTSNYESAARSWVGELWNDKARLRRVAMIFGVAAVAIVALVLWLTGGRYTGTDDAYVHAAKLMVTTDVSGLVKTVDVRRGPACQEGPGAVHARSQAVPDRGRQCQG